MNAADFAAWGGLFPVRTHPRRAKGNPSAGAGIFALIAIVNSNDRKPATFSPG
ncbi:hypothetical protein [Arthrobacter sp. 4R501]|uniref:hypothetical protein n=1 Tax=Arthrobacter sp. 4R501 TaxID=2058886 RepID=UPI0015E482AA|nr:hypothetical protein [Arthrobacter sp. 4R501]